MSNSVQTWKQWVQDFKHGRTHVAYGLIISTVTSTVGAMFTGPVILRSLFLISAIASVGSLVDTVAHLYYH